MVTGVWNIEIITNEDQLSNDLFLLTPVKRNNFLLRLPRHVIFFLSFCRKFPQSNILVPCHTFPAKQSAFSALLVNHFITRWDFLSFVTNFIYTFIFVIKLSVFWTSEFSLSESLESDNSCSSANKSAHFVSRIANVISNSSSFISWSIMVLTSDF